MTFGEKLKQLREQKGMTQDELAANLYVSRTAVSKWETNRSYPSIDSLKAIQQEFGVSVDELISDEDVQGSLDARKRESRTFYWLAIGCFAFAILFCVLSVLVYNAGYISWVLPLRVVAIIGVAGYFAFVTVSKAKYQAKPAAKASKLRFWVTRLILLLIIAAVAIAFLLQPVG